MDNNKLPFNLLMCNTNLNKQLEYLCELRIVSDYVDEYIEINKDKINRVLDNEIQSIIFYIKGYLDNGIRITFIINYNNDIKQFVFIPKYKISSNSCYKFDIINNDISLGKVLDLINEDSIKRIKVECNYD